MPKIRDYAVTLTPVEPGDNGSFSYVLFDDTEEMKSQKYPVVAASLDELLAQVGCLAHDLAKPCVASIFMANRRERKPNGFDRATQRLQYNFPKEVVAA